MEWTKQRLAHYLGQVRLVVDFQGVTGEELERVFQGEAMKRLELLEQIVYNDYQSDSEKLEQITREVLEEQAT